MNTNLHNSKKIVICLPTYNEATNIEYTITEILKRLPYCQIFIIDDNSPDGTGSIADRLAKATPNIRVIHRPEKQGLGVAYRHGFRVALCQTDADLIIQMDADMSHNPLHLWEMITTAESADLVIGSRYVQSGRTENWNVIRQGISAFGSFYAKRILSLPYNDLTSGFKVWSRDLLETILKHKITSNGYSFQIEMTYYAHLLNAHIIEIPIVFVDRNIGKSKMTLGNVFEAFWRVFLFRLQKKTPNPLETRSF